MGSLLCAKVVFILCALLFLSLGFALALILYIAEEQGTHFFIAFFIPMEIGCLAGIAYSVYFWWTIKPEEIQEEEINLE
jgi:energy-coupling factor transporter transmembrane protein EcfT